MNLDILGKHIQDYMEYLKKTEAREELADRQTRLKYYQSFSRSKIKSMSKEEFYEYFAKLFAMLIWGNKQYVVDKIIEDNGFDNFKDNLAEFLWGENDLVKRWDDFRGTIKGMGPAMMSELLCYVYPNECILWNRRAYVALNYLGVTKLPKYSYQFTGKVYLKLCDIGRNIASELNNSGIKNANLLDVDYFIWEELQVENNLSQIFSKKDPVKNEEIVEEKIEINNETSIFIHNEIRDKLEDIGNWLGFKAGTEKKIADGSKVDTIWEATIGNMGRVIYVFEVQTKGSIDSLIINLLKSLNNPAVQCVVAVSDQTQIEKIKKHATGVKDLTGKIKFWNYREVLDVHNSLQGVNESINRLGLVPEGFIISNT